MQKWILNNGRSQCVCSPLPVLLVAAANTQVNKIPIYFLLAGCDWEASGKYGIVTNLLEGLSNMYLELIFLRIRG